MALSSSALITLDDVRDYLATLPGDTDEDEQLEALIEAASRAITLYTERDFIAVDGDTRVFAYDGSGYLSLANNDLRSIDAITIGIDSPTALSTSQYRLMPKPSRHGVYSYIALQGYATYTHYGHGFGHYGHTFGLGTEVAITGDWGFASVPVDVQLACKMQVTYWQRKGRMAFTRSYNSETGTVEGGEGLVGSAMALLWPYKLTTVA